METGSTRVYVVPRAGGGGELRETPTGPVLGTTDTKQGALGRATLTVEGNGGGQIVVVAPDGTVQRSIAVDPAPPRPRWYVRPGKARWLLLVLAGVQLALLLVERRAGPWDLVLAAGMVVLLVWSLVLILRSRALDRSRVLTDEAGRG